MQIACGELRWNGARQHAGRMGKRANSLRRASLGRCETACGERDSMLDGEETVQIAWEGARQHAGRRGNRANSLRRFRWEGARQHAGGEETVQIACAELRWNGARQHAGRMGNRAHSLR